MFNSDHTSESWPGLKLNELFLESMNTTFDWVGDVFNTNFLGFNSRSKPIHTVGAYAKMSFIPVGNHQYTGMYKGAPHGFVRMSSGTEPTSWPTWPLKPGMGLKFLRDGMDSGNVVAMYDLMGNPTNDWNYFS